ncbi:FAD-dependent oxidoreductase [Paenibacillus urinalis]|uniref:Glycerol-3-phosphate dehydrogenase n=1 Tax=Paenibacillus urinalis TaxID=521520 RepID=A0ABY7XEX0_9BACL|nr:FAD-dependent oxidoreductase [Paenibacillus urinalis]WDH98514.1 FAD-dependent oxidoreductase [Paenibacillus urinalis]WDI02205.1 FAD-dependent oxidoreductase [Paenibacillus urinalis]
MTGFAEMNRTDAITAMSKENFDLLIIGGGITGAGIALDAVTRGMKVALVEMQDFAAGTSSRSTKLVHGGLRYLKQMQIDVVAEVGKERAIVYENGPHVTTPEWMLLPFYEGGTFGKFMTSIGLRVYDFLAGVKRSERRVMLSKEKTLSKEPLLKKEGMLGGGYYVEYRTDDARLTIEVMKEAVKNGALAINYVKANSFIYKDGKVCGIQAKDLIGGSDFTIHGAKVVNATGPWVDQLREKDQSRQGKVLQHTKGIHLVIDQSRFPLKQAIYFDTPDGRMVFAIPRDGKAYVGTTDTVYKEELANPIIEKEDAEYVIKAINYMFSDLDITIDDVESGWAGIRPLIFQEGKSASEISRKDEIWQSNSGLITIAGGKLTGYRKMAENVVDLTATLLHNEGKGPFKACQTVRMPISGGHVGGSAGYPAFVQRMTEVGMRHGLTQADAVRLSHMYGSNAERLFQHTEGSEQSLGNNLPMEVLMQLNYAMKEEMAVTPADFFIRRTGALFFHMDWVKKYKAPVIEYMSKVNGWTEVEQQIYTQELDQLITEAKPAAG